MKQESQAHPEISYSILDVVTIIRNRLDNFQYFTDMYERYGDFCWALYRYENGIPVEYIAHDGGEPEDQILPRDWDWVPTALKNAYELGRKHGQGEKHV